MIFRIINEIDDARNLPLLGSPIQLVGQPQPLLDLGVDLLDRAETDAMRDAIAFLEAAGCDQTVWKRSIDAFQCQAQIEPLLGRRLELGEDVISVQGHDGLAGTDLDVGAQLAGPLDQGIVDRPETGLLAGVHLLDILGRCLEIGIRIGALEAGAKGALGDEAGSGASKTVLGPEPGLALGQALGTRGREKLDPLLDRATGLGRKVVDDLVGVGDYRVDAKGHIRLLSGHDLTSPILMISAIEDLVD